MTKPATRACIHRREPYDVYGGRGRCPNTDTAGRWGNPFTRARHGDKALKFYLDWLAGKGSWVADRARRELPGKAVGCWCPPGKPCHVEILVRLANGEELAAVREDILRRLGPEQKELFA